MEVFRDYAYYYNAFYQNKDYEAESRQVDKLLKRYGCDIKRIINYGCGTGRHDLALSRLGYRCTGVDMSSLMIKIARENAATENTEIDFQVADVRTYESNEKYDAVISLFHVMSYQNSNRDILSAFQAARNVLEVGGVFLFDVWYGPGVLSDRPMVRVKEIEDGINRLVRIARPVMHDKENIVDVCYEVFVMDKETGNTKTINETHNMRYFFRPELEFYLQQTGFELLDNVDCQTLGETGYDSWTSYFIARAI